MSVLPRYPVYVPSAGRADVCTTPSFLLRDGVPFKLVVQPCELAEYAARFGAENILTLPWDNEGRKDGLLRARNWIRDHAEATGAARHWQLDDNIMGIWRRWKARKIRCEAGIGLRVCEDFSDRYTNVGISGLNYYMFSINKLKQPPFVRNVHVYSCTLINHAMPFRWRLNYNDDTDLCLQCLAGGWCTVLLNAFLAWKMTTMTVKGGNTDDLYRISDGRLRMARILERTWPGVAETSRRFNRPQHVVYWGKFDTPLKRRPDVDFNALPDVEEYGMKLRAIADVSKKELWDPVRELLQKSEAEAAAATPARRRRARS